MSRALFIAAYDITDENRLRNALELMKGYSLGRQKSVFECFLTPSERLELLREACKLLDLRTDRFLLIRVDRRAPVLTLGKATPPEDPPIFYIE